MDSSKSVFSFSEIQPQFWSGELIKGGEILTSGEVEFVDALSGSFDRGFEGVFGANRILDHLKRAIYLSRSLANSRFAFLVTVASVPDNEFENPAVTVDIASVDQAYLVDSFLAIFLKYDLVPTLILHPLLEITRTENGALHTAHLPSVDYMSKSQLESYIHFDLPVEQAMVSLDEIRADLGDLFSYLQALSDDRLAIENATVNYWVDSGDYGIERDDFIVLGARIADQNLGILRVFANCSGTSKTLLIPESNAPNQWQLVPFVSPILSNEALVVSPQFKPENSSYAFADFVIGVPSRKLNGLSTRTKRAIDAIRQALAIPSESYSYNELGELLAGLSSYELELLNDHDAVRILSSLILARDTNQIVTLTSVLSSDRVARIYLYVPTKIYRSQMVFEVKSRLVEIFDGATICCKEANVDQRRVRIDIDIIALSKSDETDNLMSICDFVSSVAQEVARTWSDRVAELVSMRHGELPASALCRRYQRVFDSTYKNDYLPITGADDIDRIESAIQTDNIWVGFTSQNARQPIQEIHTGQDGVRLRILNLGEFRKLSFLLPLVETFGISVVDEIPYELRSPTSNAPVWLYDFGVEVSVGKSDIDSEALLSFEGTFADVFLGDLDADLLNSLVLKAGLNTNGVVLLRTLANYQRFCRGSASVPVAISIIATYPMVALALVKYFEARFLNEANDFFIAAARKTVVDLIDAISTLEHDLFFRQLVRICDAALRTNLFVRTKQSDPTAIKIRSSEVPGLGDPVPLVETYVFGPHVEGVHLRSSLVARGGIRYSDRKDDYRLEILGLMKAQSVKNAVIVPHGAKGGFVLRGHNTSERDVELAYESFIEALLSITDNVSDHRVTHPPIGPIYDGDDPYLVVAADKGTASFSDLANAIAIRMNFWLKDAFASGGSSGYDHKEIGITAKGVWVSVRHHFSKLSIDPERDQIRVIGLGDMSGDVFGNGMLLSRTMLLIGAFDHRDIFIDPTPVPDIAFKERLRLFRLERSSWQSYDKSLISTGGGIFSRASKSIVLSSAAAEALGTIPGAYAPAELIRILLRAPVDLIWNGGIGTYVRASNEDDSSIGDKSNDTLRVSAGEIRAKVIAEGGNLGLSQLSRIELAQDNVALNTDAIDNSAGVDTSDHEVNLKILYDNSAELKSLDRVELLRSLTIDVEALVLADNLWQNWSITIAQAEFEQMRGVYAELVALLEEQGGLNRSIEFVPTGESLLSGEPLTRPEIAILLAYEKLRLKQEFIRAGAVESDMFSTFALGYFPKSLRELIGSEVRLHPLWPELVSNYLVNYIVNTAGPTYVMRTVDESGHGLLEIAECFILANDIFHTADLLEAMICDYSLGFGDAQDGFIGTVRFQERVTRWMLRDLERFHALDREKFSFAARQLMRDLFAVPSAQLFQYIGHHTTENRDDARFMLARLAGVATSIMEVSCLAQELNVADISEFARIYFSVGEMLVIPDFLNSVRDLARKTSWERQVRISVRDDIDSVHAQAVRLFLRQTSEIDREKLEHRFKEAGQKSKDEMTFANSPTSTEALPLPQDLLAKLVVGVRQLRRVIEGQ